MISTNNVLSRMEYIHGFAEITVFTASILHNAMKEIDWRDWIRYLPGHPELHATHGASGLDGVVTKISNRQHTFRKGEYDKNKVVLAAGIHFGSLLKDNPYGRGIIFETCYAHTLTHAREKARMLLWDSDKPRPPAVVLVVLEKRG